MHVREKRKQHVAASSGAPDALCGGQPRLFLEWTSHSSCHKSEGVPLEPRGVFMCQGEGAVFFTFSAMDISESDGEMYVTIRNAAMLPSRSAVTTPALFIFRDQCRESTPVICAF